MKTVKYEKQVDIRFDTDVCVVGGGPAGVAAAVAAARCGARVCLFEKEQCFGGAATSAKVPAFMRFSDGVHFLAGGIGKEIFDSLYEGVDYTQIEFSIDTEKLKQVYDNMVKTSGVTFLFETNLLDVKKEGGFVKYAIFKGKERLFAVKANCFIDATGDGFLSVAAGAEFTLGDGNGHMMPATLCSLWGDINWNKAVVELGKDPDNRFLKKAFADGIFTVEDPSLPGMWKLERHYGGGNIGHAFGVDGTDETSITEAIVQMRRRIREYERYYTEYLDGYENAKLLLTADVLGIRETRRIHCDYMARREDYMTQAVFTDEIGRYAYPIDIHSYQIGVDEGLGDVYAKGYEKGKSYGISYRSLIPLGLDNILVAGRCIGAERAMSGSVRVMPCCFITGMAAGIAAAIASQERQMVRHINIKDLQNKLIAMGAYIPYVNR